MKQKKLLIIIPYFIPAYGYGGPIKVAYDHSIELIKRGFEVSVVTTDALDDKNRNKVLEETIDGIKIYRFKNFSNRLAKFHNIYLPLGMRKWLRKNIKNYDIVHIHDILNIPALLGSNYAKKNQIKYFLHPHGTLGERHISSRKSLIKRLLLKTFSYMLDDAKTIFALTNQEKKDIKKFTKNENIVILPNGVNLKEFENIPNINLREKYGLDSDTIIFAFLGRIQYIKGLDIALSLLSEYDKVNKNWRYLIIGPDEGEKDKLVNLSKKLGIFDKIIWYGISTGKEKYSLLKASDVFLLTSRAEGFPMTILEALGCGLPVFISEGCNLPEVDGTVGVEIMNNKITGSDLEKFVMEGEKYERNIHSFLMNYDIKNIIYNLIDRYNE